MKKLASIICFMLLACLSYGQAYQSFGKKIKPKAAISTSELQNKMAGADAVTTKVEGEVESVCQAKGCWMKLKLDNGETMRVSFKDYGFFVPKDIAGKRVIVAGEAKRKEISVDEQRHYAEDAGKSAAEIAAITTPKKELTFVADGVLIPKK